MSIIKFGIKNFWFLIICATTVVSSSLLYRAVNADLLLFHKVERLADQGAISESIALLKTAVNRIDGNDTVENIFQLCLANQQYEDALTIALFFLAESDGHTQFSFKPADEFIAAGRFNEASVFLQKSLELRPENKSLRFRYARVLSWLDKLDESVTQYKIILGENK